MPRIAEYLDPYEMLLLLREAVGETAGQRAFARRHGISPRQLNNVLRERCGVPACLSVPLGYRRALVYIRRELPGE